MILKALLIAVLQGIIEFLPVSSSGHELLIYNWLGMEYPPLIPLLSLVHLGSMFAVLFLFNRDFIKVLAEFLRLPGVFRGKIDYKINQMKQGRQYFISHIFRTNYGKLLLLMTLGNLPAILAGIYGYRLAEELTGSVLAVGMGALFTALFLLVAALLPVKDRTPVELKVWQILFVGICQAAAIIPGVSSFGMALCALLFMGQTKKSAVKCAMMMQAPLYLGAFVYSVKDYFAGGFSAAAFLTIPLALIFSAILGCLVIRSCLSRVMKDKGYIFAAYNFLFALICIIYHISLGY